MRTLISRAGILGVALALVACGGGDDSFSPTSATVAGDYTARVFTLTSSVGTTDLLALGATVVVSLEPGGTTTGRLFVPGGAEDGGDLDEDLAGTWSLTGNTVTFNQSSDTFIRDADFTAGPDNLIGEGVFGGATVRLVLQKSK
jgi:ABC-type Fe3+-hydroxamate transport system substrate-binding protein